MLCFGSFLLQENPQVFAFEGQNIRNMTFTVNVLLTCILYCDAGPGSRGGGVLPYKGLMGTCGQPGYVFRDFCLKQGIEFIIFCLNQVIGLSIFVLKGM